MGEFIDSLKFAGGSFAIINSKALRDIIEAAHQYDVLVSTGGFIEYVLTQGQEAARKYIRQCKLAGFDIVEVSSGFVTIPTDDWLADLCRVEGRWKSPRRTAVPLRDSPDH